MQRINATEHKVEKILRLYPHARNSDDILYLHILNCIHGTSLTAMELFSHRDELGIPSYETVSRCRRKLQAKFPELQAVADVEAMREAEEENFRGYARKA